MSWIKHRGQQPSPAQPTNPDVPFYNPNQFSQPQQQWQPQFNQPSSNHLSNAPPQNYPQERTPTPNQTQWNNTQPINQYPKTISPNINQRRASVDSQIPLPQNNNLTQWTQPYPQNYPPNQQMYNPQQNFNPQSREFNSLQQKQPFNYNPQENYNQNLQYQQNFQMQNNNEFYVNNNQQHSTQFNQFSNQSQNIPHQMQNNYLYSQQAYNQNFNQQTNQAESSNLPPNNQPAQNYQQNNLIQSNSPQINSNNFNLPTNQKNMSDDFESWNDWGSSDTWNEVSINRNNNPHNVSKNDTWNWSINENTTTSNISNSEDNFRKTNDGFEHQTNKTDQINSEGAISNFNPEISNDPNIHQHIPTFEKVGTKAIEKLKEIKENSIFESNTKFVREYLEQENAATDTPTSSISSYQQHILNGSNKLTPQWSIESQVSSQDSSELGPNGTQPFSQTSSSESSSVGPKISTIRKIANINQEINLSASNTYEYSSVQSQIAEVSQAIENLTLQHYENSEIPDDKIESSHSYSKSYLPDGSAFVHDDGNLKINKPENSSNLDVNLETIPDNVERPDQYLLTNKCPNSSNKLVNKQIVEIVENLEIAPKNDRNQYLETGQLTETESNEFDRSIGTTNMYVQQLKNDDAADNPPLPPGFSRMVLGQNEFSNSQISDGDYSLNNSENNSRILTGLDRVVDGESERNSQPTTIQSNVPQANNRLSVNDDLPPLGLHRMIPGESSSPESRINRSNNVKYITQVSSQTNNENNDKVSNNAVNSKQPILQRSETIGGADSPNNKTIASSSSNYSVKQSRDLENKKSQSREMLSIGDGQNSDVENDNKLRPSSVSPRGNGTSNTSDNNLNTGLLPPKSVRDQTDGENTTDKDKLLMKKQNNRLSNRNQKKGHGRSDSSEGLELDEDERIPHRRNRRSSKSPARELYNLDDSQDRYDDRPPRHPSSGKQRHRRDESSPDKREQKERYKDRRSRYHRQDSQYYDDDTPEDNYSDKEKYERGDHKRGGSKERDYIDRGYSSLRREKDRHGRIQNDKYKDRQSVDRFSDDYYSGYTRNDDDYYGSRESNKGSRPTSRNDIPYRNRTSRPEKDQRKLRDPYSNSMYQGYGMYDPYSMYNYAAAQQYQQQYQYYENLRRTNPEAYAEWYRKFYQNQMKMPPSGVAYNRNVQPNDERASVHSGRSSTNDDLRKDRYARPSATQQHNFYNNSSHSNSSLLGGFYQQQGPPTSLSYTNDDYRLDATDSLLNTSLSFTGMDSTLGDQKQPDRLTPVKFGASHMKASISSGYLINIIPNDYYFDETLSNNVSQFKESNTIQILDLQKLLLNDPEHQELVDYPGPLIKGLTNKKVLIEFCENKIKKAINNSAHNNLGSKEVSSTFLIDRDSYILLWDLLILLLRQNGVIVGTDIAELLMKNTKLTGSSCLTSQQSGRNSVMSSRSSLMDDLGNHPSLSVDSLTVQPNQQNDDNSINSATQNSTASGVNNSIKMTSQSLNKNGSVSNGAGLSETMVTNKFREFLLYGSCKEALEWAMKHGLWGHALFLASKLDKRTYANVMMRFANGLTINDPLQTLYQLLSGRQPAVVTSVSDDKWGDWRPHLAMILSNTSQRPELDRKAITTLGDTLFSRGLIYSAHFCYLMSQVSFGKYETKNSRLVLIGSSNQKSFKEFASNEAIVMTEIYEYACSLNDKSFVIPEFQIYKYLLANRLFAHGFFEKALLYTEKLATIIAQCPNRYNIQFGLKVLKLAERLKARDDAIRSEMDLTSNLLDSVEDDSNIDADSNYLANAPPTNEVNWITELKAVLNDNSMGLFSHETQSLSNLASSELDITSNAATPLQPSDPKQMQYDSQQNQFVQQNNYEYSNNLQQTYQPTVQPNENDQTQQYFQPQLQQVNNQQNAYADQLYTTSDNGQNYQTQWANNSEYNQSNYQQDYGNQNFPSDQQNIDQSLDQNQSSYGYWNNEDAPRPQITLPNSTSSNDFDNDQVENKKQIKTAVDNKTKSPEKKNEKQQGSSNSGWFGGLWNKLAMKPKNQMILPDDKNPTIVWDSKKNRWVNLDEDENESSNFKPPPKLSEFSQSNSSPMQSSSNFNQTNNNQMKTVENFPPQSMPTQMPLKSQQQQLMNNNDNQTLPQQPQLKAPSQVNNMFKMQRGKGLKKAYVDVFNSSVGKPASTLPSDILPNNNGPIPNYFVPQVPTSNDNLMSTNSSQNNYNQPISRWSSASSLSREVERYTSSSLPRFSSMNKVNAPMMFNPNQYTGSN